MQISSVSTVVASVPCVVVDIQRGQEHGGMSARSMMVRVQPIDFSLFHFMMSFVS